MKHTNNNSGQGLTEYLILVFLVAMVSIGTVKTMGNKIQTRLNHVNKEIQEKLDIGG